MFPWYFPTVTPSYLQEKKVVYLLCLFPEEEVIADRLKNNNYDIVHIIQIVNINVFLYGWRTENYSEYICACCENSFDTEKSRYNHINKGALPYKDISPYHYLDTQLFL